MSAQPVLAPSVVSRRPRRRRAWVYPLACAALALPAVVWFLTRPSAGTPATDVPTARVERGDVLVNVVAAGDLRGGSTELLSVPMTGQGQLVATWLISQGAPVHPGDVVARFDTTQQQYTLREAEADLAEAAQQVIKARDDAAAQREDDRYALLKAENDVALARLDVQRNPIVSIIDGRKNDLALAAALAHLGQLQHDLASRRASGEAQIALQQAAADKARTAADQAKRNIANSVLRSHTAGFVEIQQNTNTNFFFDGMVLPRIQVGDTLRPGMAVAEIPSLSGWSVHASVGELDRGHLRAGQPASISFVSLPGVVLQGHVTAIGGLIGSMWDRRFDCTIGLDGGPPELRPGLSARIVITTDRLHNVLWVPAQAIFEQDGRPIVYVPDRGGFAPHPITVLRRSESRAAISGIALGELVALNNPEVRPAPKQQTSGPLGALEK
jgi:HlyD family secretion protein